MIRRRLRWLRASRARRGDGTLLICMAMSGVGAFFILAAFARSLRDAMP